jgi:hypothetical protein
MSIAPGEDRLVDPVMGQPIRLRKQHAYCLAHRLLRHPRFSNVAPPEATAGRTPL